MHLLHLIAPAATRVLLRLLYRHVTCSGVGVTFAEPRQRMAFDGQILRKDADGKLDGGATRQAQAEAA